MICLKLQPYRQHSVRKVLNQKLTQNFLGPFLWKQRSGRWLIDSNCHQGHASIPPFMSLNSKDMLGSSPYKELCLSLDWMELKSKSNIVFLPFINKSLGHLAMPRWVLDPISQQSTAGGESISKIFDDATPCASTYGWIVFKICDCFERIHSFSLLTVCKRSY